MSVNSGMRIVCLWFFESSICLSLGCIPPRLLWFEMSEVWTGTWHLARRASSFAVFPAQIFTFYGGRRCEPVTCTKPSVRNVFKVRVFVRVL